MRSAKKSAQRQRCWDAAAGSPQILGAKSDQTPKRTAKYINMMLCKAAQGGDPADVLSVVSSRRTDMSCVNLSTAIHKVARLSKEGTRSISPNDTQLKLLSSQIHAMLQTQVDLDAWTEEMPRCLSTISWSYGTLQFQDPTISQILELISKMSQPQLHLFNPLELTNLLWGMARTQTRAAPLFQSSGHCIVAQLEPFSTSNLTTLVWTFAAVRQAQPDILNQVVAELGLRMHSSQINPVEIANVLWGVATAKLRPNRGIFHEIGCRALALLRDFKLHELSITAWAFSRVGVRHDGLFAGIAEHLRRCPDLRRQIHPQGIANLLWAFERQKALDSSVVPQFLLTLPSLLTVARRLLPELKPQEFTCVLLAVTKFGFTLNDCREADDLLMAAVHTGGALLHRLSVAQCMDLFEAYAGFLGGGDRMPGSCTVFVCALVQACFDGSPGFEVIGLHRIVAVACLATSMVPEDLRRVVLGRVAQSALRVPHSRLLAAGLRKLLSMSGLPSDSDPAGMRATLASLLAHGPADLSTSGHDCETVPSGDQTDTSDEMPAEQDQESHEDCNMQCQRGGASEGSPAMARPLALHGQTSARRAPRGASGPFAQVLGLLDSSGSRSPECLPGESVPFDGGIHEPKVLARCRKHEPQQPPPPSPLATTPTTKQVHDILATPPISEEGFVDPLSAVRSYMVKNTFVELEEAGPRLGAARYFSEQPQPADLLSAAGSPTSAPSPHWPRAAPADLHRQAGPQGLPEPKNSMLRAPLGHCRALNAEQFLRDRTVGASSEGCIMSSLCGPMDASPFIVKNTFLEFVDDNEANAAKLCASRFCSEQPRPLVR